jgi:hypothetical protein
LKEFAAKEKLEIVLSGLVQRNDVTPENCTIAD